MRLYLDQDVDVGLAIRLIGQTYNTVTTRDAGNLGNSDEEQLEYAVNNQMAILTHNRKHFRRLHRDYLRLGQHHCAIIVSTRVSLDELERRLLNLLRNVSADVADNRLFSLADYR
jgi:predicted nuclease of predicted toxin-antitoxin system